jgi:hypothetical protein
MNQAFKKACLAIPFLMGAVSQAREPASLPVDFDRDVRPILSNHCYTCHGPDDQQRQANLRLDQHSAIVGAGDSGKPAVVAGQPAESEILRRIQSADSDLRMPPSESGPPLAPEQIEILTRWIQDGAQWSNHWAFEPIRQPAVPTDDLAEGQVHNAIDAFVLRQLTSRDVRQAPRETKERLIRRVSLDLTGLPPTLADVDAFVADDSQQAFEKVVDRLLASQHFGERLAVPWLDLARYGDTSGYHNDSLRDMWLWREWIIQALNRNMPFDQFTREQLAGDLVPDASIEQQIASGFHRNVMTSDEGGLIDAEYRNLYVVDRVATTGVTWLGLTVACAQCHDHKYDPISQADFYKLYAFFNNVPENGKDGVRDRNPKPFLRVPSAEDSQKLTEFDAQLAALNGTLSGITEGLADRQLAWEDQFVSSQSSLSTPALSAPTPRALFPMDGQGAGQVANTETPLAPSGQGKPEFVPGAMGQALKTSGAGWFEYANAFDFTQDTPWSVSLLLSVSKAGGSPLGQMDDSNAARGWDIEFHGLRPSFHLIHQWPKNAIHLQANEDFPENTFTHLTITYDGSAKAAGVKLYVNGGLAPVTVKTDKLRGDISNTTPFSIGRRGPGGTPFNGLIDEVQIFDCELSELEVASLNSAEALRIARLPVAERSEQQQKTLTQFFQRTQLPELASTQAALAELKKSKEEFEKALPNTMVMSEMEKPRDTFIKVRGNYDQDGEQVLASVPTFLPQIPAPAEGTLNRLDLARWLTSPEHPLTARVAVNRWWAMLFGTGLVKTLNDFGTQGERPTHPQLLDWLAADFLRDWDIKRSIKQMVMSATYQQTAQASPELLQSDSENRWLARGPRQRLDAEFLRDNALAIAGVLNPTIGGKSIKPAQPEGTWEINEMSGYKYDKSQGADLYRRGLYVYWRRSTVYPSFVTLDAPTREFCVAQRAKTSTPLQSLVLMNDPVFVEAARGLAQRVLAEPNLDDAGRVRLAWRLALAREPSLSELQILQHVLQQQLTTYRADLDSAQLFVAVGDLQRPEKLDVAELAAWTALSNVLLNLNETLSN